MGKFISSIKESFALRHLRKEIYLQKKRDKKYVALEDAKNIAIICNLTDDDYAYLNIINYSKKHISEGKKITMVFCFLDKECPNFYNHDTILIDKNSINSIGIPNDKIIDNFINTEFDYLLDFSTENLFPLTYIFALSIAKLKISKHVLETSKYADVILSLPETNDVRDYFNALNQYLNISYK